MSTKRSAVQSLNKERFAFMFASMVGRRVTVKLRNLSAYEGMFSGSSMDKGEYTVLLRMAHELPSENRLSGPVHDQMIIPGKDIVMLTALEVAEEGIEKKEVEEMGADDFKTDVEINTTKRGFSMRGERHLESWADLKDEENQDMELESKAGGWSGPQDQFLVAQKMGVVSTYSEDLYTTPLDYSQLSSAQRARAEQIAKEIEGGRNYSSQEEGGDGDDEEAKFSAVIGTGGYTGKQRANHPSETASSWRKSDGANTRLNALNLEPASSSKPHFQAPAPAAPKPVVSASSALKQPPPATSPSGTSSEMKGINALNLEPASVNRVGAGWDPATTKYKAGGAGGGNLTKRDFEIALAEINSRPAVGSVGKGKGKGGSGSTKEQQQQKFSFNPNASTFTPGGPPAPPAPSGNGNTLNIAITPGGSLSGTLKAGNYDFYEGPAGQQGPPPPMVMFPQGMMPMPMMMPPPVQPMGPPPAFGPLIESSQMDKRSISELVGKLYYLQPSTPSTSSSSSSYEWTTEKQNPSYKDALGPIPPGVTPMMPPMMPPPVMAPGYTMPYPPFYPAGPPPQGGGRGRPFLPHAHPHQYGFPSQPGVGGGYRGGSYGRGGGGSSQSQQSDRLE